MYKSQTQEFSRIEEKALTTYPKNRIPALLNSGIIRADNVFWRKHIANYLEWNNNDTGDNLYFTTQQRKTILSYEYGNWIKAGNGISQLK